MMNDPLMIIDKLLTHQIRCEREEQAVRRAINKRLYELDPETREFLADDGPEYQPSSSASVPFAALERK